MGVTVHVEVKDVQVHEVVITEGAGEGNKYLHNLDSAEPQQLAQVLWATGGQ